MPHPIEIVRRRVILRMGKTWGGGFLLGIIMLVISSIGLALNLSEQPTRPAFIWVTVSAAIVSLGFIAVPTLKFLFSKRDGRTLLMWAVIDDDEQSVADLLLAGTDVNEKDRYGQTSLMHAIRTSTLSMVRLLIERGAGLNEVSVYPYEGGTALILAVQRGDPAIIELLINAGADVNQKDSDGWTALYAAKRKNDGTISDLLRRAGAK